ncbi:transposase [Comamonas sp. NLF-1-9]|nr:transposase [Comamonas sp. NLF-1-9]
MSAQVRSASGGRTVSLGLQGNAAPYPEDKGGRQIIGLERMLRMHLAQHWLSLVDGAFELALHDSANLGRFIGIDRGREHGCSRYLQTVVY